METGTLGDVVSSVCALPRPLQCTSTVSQGCTLFLLQLSGSVSPKARCKVPSRSRTGPLARRVPQRWLQTCPGAPQWGQRVTCLPPDPSFCSSSGANVNAKDTVWLTPLHRAAASRNEVGSLWLSVLLAWGWGALVGGEDCASPSLFHLFWFWLRWVVSLEWRGDEHIIQRLKMRAGKKICLVPFPLCFRS